MLSGFRRLTRTGNQQFTFLLYRRFCAGPGEVGVIEPTAFVNKTATIGRNTYIGHFVYIGPNVHIGDNCVVRDSCTIRNCDIGDRVVLNSGIRIGQDGFGFHISENHDNPSHEKKPQELRVEIMSDVEIGSNTTIDRGSWRNTVVGSNTKLDNLIQVGHNVVIGDGCLICAQTGIAGSTTIGKGVLIGGQVGIAQHLSIGDGVRIAAKSGVMQDLQQGRSYGGYPAVEVKDFHRQTLFLKQSTLRARS